MKKINKIAIARKAIRQHIRKAGVHVVDISAMHRVGMEAIKDLCKNESIANELAWEAAKDVSFE